jgi:hypothetical protein
MWSAIQALFGANRPSVWRERPHSVQQVDDFGFVKSCCREKNEKNTEKKHEKKWKTKPLLSAKIAYLKQLFCVQSIT